MHNWISYAETITIAAEGDWVPHSSIKKDLTGPEGLAPEIIKKVFRLKGIDVKYVTLPFARCMYDTLIGKVVGCFDDSVMVENKNQYYWHKTPIFDAELSVLAKSNAEDHHM
jgi:polar amino acid transport system substrate-binding protein